LADTGFDVAIVSAERRKAARGEALYLQADIAELGGHEGIVREVNRRLGAIDCLVNNAGVTSLRRGDMLELTAESFDRCVAVNLRGTFFLTQAVARSMLKRRARTYRSLITISSANAEIVGLNRADYCMTKTALSMMSKLYAARLAAHGIQVFEVRPGIIRTGMTAPAKKKYDAYIAAGGVPAMRWGTPADVGAAVATLARGAIPFSTGEIVNVGGGMHLHRV
jgi:3-oxoacyl-[acyl-carrier protein] reductase